MFKILSTFFGPLVAIETDIRISQEILECGHWEFQDTLKIVSIYEHYFRNCQGLMLDIGCNIGAWTLPLAHRYSQNTILAFDCQPLVIDCINQTVRLNQLNNVTAQCCAVSDQCSQVVYNKIDYKWGANFGAYEFEAPYANSDFNGRTTNDADVISTLTIDSMNLERVVFIKLDIEGMEYKALQGAKDTIQRCRPFIVFEHHKTDRKGAEDFCRNLNYRLLNTVGQMSLAVPKL